MDKTRLEKPIPTTRYSTRNVPKRGDEGTFVRITNLNVSNYYHEVGKIDLSSPKLLKNTPIVIINLKNRFALSK